MANVLIPKKSTVAAKVPTTSDLALGEIAINHADAKLYARHPVSGTVQEIGAAAGSLSIDTTAADLFSATSGTLSADDLGSDKIYFWDDSAGRATGLDLGTGLAITGTTLNNTGSLTGTGSVDNAILRADGTGGSTLQSSGLIVDDAVVAYSVTGDASTDVITATGHIYTANQTVIFSGLTGGSGLSNGTLYFVRDISGSTFKVSTTSGGAAVNFTTNITAGSVIAIQANVAISQNTTETNSALVLTPKGTGALIAGPKPDGTAVGGNARGTRSIDLQMVRSGGATPQAKVCSGNSSALLGGQSNTISGNYAGIVAGLDNSIGTGDNYAFIGAGQLNSIGSGTSGQYGTIVCGVTNALTAQYGVIGGGYVNSASGVFSAILGGTNARADRRGMQAHASSTFGLAFANNGDAQRARFVLNCKTTTNAAVEMALDGSATRLTIPSGKSVGGTIQICGTTSGGETANLYIRQFLIRNRVGTTALIGSIQTVGTDIIGLAVGGISLTANDGERGAGTGDDALRVEVTGFAPVTACTTSGSGTAAVVNKTGHGFSNNDDIVFTSLTGGAGLTATTVTYWVINATANTFQVSTTRGGAAVNITTNYTDMTATRVIRWVANVDCTEIGHGT